MICDLRSNFQNQSILIFSRAQSPSLDPLKWSMTYKQVQLVKSLMRFERKLVRQERMF